MKISCDNTEIKISSHWQNGDKLFKATVNNVEIGVNIRKNNRSGGYLLQHSGSDVYAQVLSLRNAELYKFMPKIEKNPKPTELTSPITGKIIKFKINEGSEVKAGQELVIIEAMKMENIIRTDYDVKIKTIEFSEGDAVGVGQVIMSFA
jgi:propionyl-CoA carboxylase alpha chain